MPHASIKYKAAVSQIAELTEPAAAAWGYDCINIAKKGASYGWKLLGFSEIQLRLVCNRNLMPHRRPVRPLKSHTSHGRHLLENLTPILAPKVRNRRKREIEAGLYTVFRKYAPGRAEMR